MRRVIWTIVHVIIFLWRGSQRELGNLVLRHCVLPLPLTITKHPLPTSQIRRTQRRALSGVRIKLTTVVFTVTRLYHDALIQIVNL